MGPVKKPKRKWFSILWSNQDWTDSGINEVINNLLNNFKILNINNINVW